MRLEGLKTIPRSSLEPIVTKTFNEKEKDFPGNFRLYIQESLVRLSFLRSHLSPPEEADDALGTFMEQGGANRLSVEDYVTLPILTLFST